MIVFESRAFWGVALKRNSSWENVWKRVLTQITLMLLFDHTITHYLNGNYIHFCYFNLYWLKSSFYSLAFIIIHYFIEYYYILECSDLRSLYDHLFLFLTMVDKSLTSVTLSLLSSCCSMVCTKNTNLACRYRGFDVWDPATGCRGSWAAELPLSEGPLAVLLLQLQHEARVVPVPAQVLPQQGLIRPQRPVQVRHKELQQRLRLYILHTS